MREQDRARERAKQGGSRTLVLAQPQQKFWNQNFSRSLIQLAMDRYLQVALCQSVGQWAVPGEVEAVQGGWCNLGKSVKEIRFSSYTLIPCFFSSLVIGGSADKEFVCNAGDLSLIPLLGRSSGQGNGYPLHYSGLENSMGCIVQGVANSWTRLSDSHLHSHFLMVNLILNLVDMFLQYIKAHTLSLFYIIYMERKKCFYICIYLELLILYSL